MSKKTNPRTKAKKPSVKKAVHGDVEIEIISQKSREKETKVGKQETRVGKPKTRVGKRKTKKPTPRQATLDIHDFLEKDSPTLNDLASVVTRTTQRSDWGSYFYSPINKRSETCGTEYSFKFNEGGCLEDEQSAIDKIKAWLDESSDSENYSELEGEISAWICGNNWISDRLFKTICNCVKSELQTAPELYNTPICRLARSDQLRYDPDRQAVYHLTPAQHWQLQCEEGTSREKAVTPGTLRDTQRLYWQISNTMQSLISTFDSDLGRDSGESAKKKPKKKYTAEQILKNSTKQFLKLKVGDNFEASAQRLNFYSPLRSWAPPATFAQSVVHSFLWRAVITGKDVYGRTFPEEWDGSVGDRTSFYCVIINWYNAAHYRIVNYHQDLEGLHSIARLLQSRVKRLKLCENQDIELPKGVSDLTRILYPQYRHHDTSTLHSEATLNIPLKELNCAVWDILKPYSGADTPSTRSHLRKYIRDKMLQLILWSRYQEEIRSFGMIPCQYIYQLELSKAGNKHIESARKEFDNVRKRSILSKKRSKSIKSINDEFIREIRNGEIGSWVIMKKKFDRSRDRALHRDNKLIHWLGDGTKNHQEGDEK